MIRIILHFVIHVIEMAKVNFKCRILEGLGMT